MKDRMIDDACIDCGMVRTIRFSCRNTRCKSCGGKASLATKAGKIYVPREKTDDESIANVLHGMRRRCNAPQSKDYDRYGGRGIYVCQEWMGKEGALAFCMWAKDNGYQKGLYIDRKDGDGPYSPDNCRWVNASGSVRNSSMAKLDELSVMGVAIYIRCGLKNSVIGGKYSVHHRTIDDIRKGKTWSDISGFKRAA